jgi:hypothetical protein
VKQERKVSGGTWRGKSEGCKESVEKVWYVVKVSKKKEERKKERKKEEKEEGMESRAEDRAWERWQKAMGKR